MGVRGNIDIPMVSETKAGFEWSLYKWSAKVLWVVATARACRGAL